MGLTTTAPLVLPTRRVLAFTSSTTWTVPTSALYVDVMVVGGGCGGRGAGNTTNPGNCGAGGGVTVLRDIYLNGTGTVSIVIGAGSNGTAGVATAGQGAAPSSAGYSAFGTYVYSQGAVGSIAGAPGNKSTISNPYGNSDTTASNFAPILINSFNANQGGSQQGTAPGVNTLASVGAQFTVANSTNLAFGYTIDGTGFGYSGGGTGLQSAGGINGINGNQTNSITSGPTVTYPPSQTLPWGAANLITFGAATAGGNSSNARTGGAAGPTGFTGGGGGSSYASGTYPYSGGAGGPGAGGGGGTCDSAGGTGGAGGNAGTNTGAGGGVGGLVNQSTGTGGAGGNGGSGFVIVSYIGTN